MAFYEMFCFDCVFFRHIVNNPQEEQATKGKRSFICEAYQNGIPIKILTGSKKHNEVFSDQTDDYIFSPKEEKVEHYKKIGYI